MVLSSGKNKAPLRHRRRQPQGHPQAKCRCRWHGRGYLYLLVTLTITLTLTVVAISISLSSFWAFWGTTTTTSSSNGSSSLFLSEFASAARRNHSFKGQDMPSSITNNIGNGCIPPRRSRGLERMQVAKPSSSYSSSGHHPHPHKEMKILCFILTESSHHPTKVKAVWDTWGRKCDKLLIASNLTDPSLGAVRMKSDPSYSNLWRKLEETIRYLCDDDQLYLEEYDWFVKVDDDSYIIMENLRYFLSNISNNDEDMDKPLIYGRRYSYPPLVDLPNMPKFFPDLPKNQAFRERFVQRVQDTHSEAKHLMYTQGGAQVMNRKYLKELVKVYDSPNNVIGTPPEDMALGMVMWYRGIAPQSASRDPQGRELFHPEPPPLMYDLPSSVAYLHQYHSQVGGVVSGPDCCSPYSISFHHVSEKQMRHYHRQLYPCLSS